VYATGRKLEQMQGLVALGCRLQQLDVTDEAAVARVVQAVVQEAGRIDILINNAGMTLKGWAIETPMTKARSVMEVRRSGVTDAAVSLTQPSCKHSTDARSARDGVHTVGIMSMMRAPSNDHARTMLVTHLVHAAGQLLWHAGDDAGRGAHNDKAAAGHDW
jgi:NAD(P)-dependent dehydrogenase (short-subunit alcohol dehydrogenase family)